MTCTACATARRAIALLFGHAAKPTVKPKLLPEAPIFMHDGMHDHVRSFDHYVIERRTNWGERE